MGATMTTMVTALALKTILTWWPQQLSGAPEVCDGKDNDCDNVVDENIPDVVNTWIGTNGNWSQASNWNTGIVPQPCHQVVISPASAYTISVTNGSIARASSISVGVNATFTHSKQRTTNNSRQRRTNRKCRRFVGMAALALRIPSIPVALHWPTAAVFWSTVQQP